MLTFRLPSIISIKSDMGISFGLALFSALATGAVLAGALFCSVMTAVGALFASTRERRGVPEASLSIGLDADEVDPDTDLRPPEEGSEICGDFADDESFGWALSYIFFQIT